MKSKTIAIILLSLSFTVESRDINLCLMNNFDFLRVDIINKKNLNCSTVLGFESFNDSALIDTVLPKLFKLDPICYCNSIVWNWGGVDKAKGYKINFVNDISSATDLFNETSYSQQKLASNKNYDLYVWAYNDSLISEALHIEAKTLPMTCGCVFYDERDNEGYRTVQIGNQCWMGENLRYASETGSSCYYKNKVMVKEYGRYYYYDIALNVCPQGWRLPTTKDINIILDNYKGDPIELYNHLKDDKNGSLNIKLGGFCDPTSSEQFKFVGSSSGIWFCNPELNNKSLILYFYSEHFSCQVFDGNKQIKYNVRCIKED